MDSLIVEVLDHRTDLHHHINSFILEEQVLLDGLRMLATTRA